jgi:hypothetical protein
MVGRQHAVDKKPLRAVAKLWQLPEAESRTIFGQVT